MERDWIVLSPDPVYGEVALTHRGYVLVLQVDDPVGVLDNGAGVTGKEILRGVILSQGSELCPGAVTSEETQTGVPASLFFTVEYRDVVSGQSVGRLDPHQQGGASPGGHGLPRVEH